MSWWLQAPSPSKCPRSSAPPGPVCASGNLTEKKPEGFGLTRGSRERHFLARPLLQHGAPPPLLLPLTQSSPARWPRSQQPDTCTVRILTPVALDSPPQCRAPRRTGRPGRPTKRDSAQATVSIPCPFLPLPAPAWFGSGLGLGFGFGLGCACFSVSDQPTPPMPDERQCTAAAAAAALPRAPVPAIPSRRAGIETKGRLPDRLPAADGRDETQQLWILNHASLARLVVYRLCACASHCFMYSTEVFVLGQKSSVRPWLSQIMVRSINYVALG